MFRYQPRDDKAALINILMKRMTRHLSHMQSIPEMLRNISCMVSWTQGSIFRDICTTNFPPQDLETFQEKCQYSCVVNESITSKNKQNAVYKPTATSHLLFHTLNYRYYISLKRSCISRPLLCVDLPCFYHPLVPSH